MKARTLGIILGVFASVAIAAPALAHHGTASFDTSKDLTLKGTVTDWIWANPHCFLKFDAMDETGTVRNWAVEVSNPTDMTKRGWARWSFKVGDVVTVTLQPVKKGAQRASGSSLRSPCTGARALWDGSPPRSAPPVPRSDPCPRARSFMARTWNGRHRPGNESSR